MLRRLAPGPWFSRVSEEEYIMLYGAQLADLDPMEMLVKLESMAGGAPCVVLVCFERPGSGQWCHRSLVAQWLGSKLAMLIPELGHEHLERDQHPMLPPSMCAQTVKT